MDEYIEREAFLKTWCESYCRPKQNCRDDCSFYDAIIQFPAADVRENVRGEWIEEKVEVGRLFGTVIRCPVCGERQEYKTNFCPDCGVDCRGDSDE